MRKHAQAQADPLARAMQHQQAGRFDQAATLYRQLLEADAKHTHASHNYGILELQRGRINEAMPLLSAALMNDPSRAQFWLSYAEAWLRADRADEAHLVMQAAREKGLQGEAADAMETRIAAAHGLKPDLAGLRKLDEAEDGSALENAARRQVEQFGRLPVLLNYLGLALLRQLRNAEALECLEESCRLDPADVNALNRRSMALSRLGQFEDAHASYLEVLTLLPESVDLLVNMADNLNKSSRNAEAMIWLHKALAIQPDSFGARINMANALSNLERYEEAEQLARAVLDEGATSVEAPLAHASALIGLHRYSDAIAALERALGIDPNQAIALAAMGGTLKDLSDLAGAERYLHRALEIKPDLDRALSLLLFVLNYNHAHGAEERLAQARRYGTLVSTKVPQPLRQWHCPPQPARLRVGVVSPDLSHHPVGYFVQALLAHLDPAEVEVLAYPTSLKSDSQTESLRRHVAAWTSLAGMSEANAARRIHEDGVHVLIDLCGHTGNHMLPLFAWKPAPVQASWLGYFATTGMAEMDYFIGDRFVMPPGEESHWVEKLWRLPESFCCFTPPDKVLEVDIPVGPLPALATGLVTFGSFNKLSKVSDATVRLWAQILKVVPRSRLLINAKEQADATVCETTRRRFAAEGIGPERLILTDWKRSRVEHLAMYQHVDIALDPFPYPGGTTSVEALWMGVPVLTLRGDRYLSHMGESINYNAGLPAWIAADEADYVAKAAAFAANVPALAELRSRLRPQVLGSPLFDAPRFARHFTQALWGMWRTYTEHQEKA